MLDKYSGNPKSGHVLILSGRKQVVYGMFRFSDPIQKLAILVQFSDPIKKPDKCAQFFNGKTDLQNFDWSVFGSSLYFDCVYLFAKHEQVKTNCYLTA